MGSTILEQLLFLVFPVEIYNLGLEKVLHLMYKWTIYGSGSVPPAVLLLLACCIAARFADELKRTRIVNPMRERLEVRHTYTVDLLKLVCSAYF